MLTHTSFRTLGKLLRLAEHLKTYREERASMTMEEVADAALAEAEDLIAGAYEESTPERDLQLFMESLGKEERCEIAALFYMGRHAVDDFAAEVRNPSLSPDQIPWHLSAKTDLYDSLIEGLKRLGDLSPKL